MQEKYFGTLEYSYTKGFKDRIIINFYIDHRLQNYCKLKEGDRIATAYDFVSGKGIITKVVSDVHKDLKKTDYPKLVYSSVLNKQGKLKAWYETESEYMWFLLLPPEIQGEQIELKVVEAHEGFIEFLSNNPKSPEEVLIRMLKNYSQLSLDSDKIENIKSLIRDLSNGKISLSNRKTDEAN